MKIVILTSLQVIPALSGTQKLIYDTAIELGKRGHVILVVSIATESKRAFSYSNIGNIVFVKIPMRRPLHELLAAIRFAIYSSFPSFKFILPFIYQKFLKIDGIDLSQLLEKTCYNVLICEDSRIFPLAIKLRSETGTPIIYRIHSVEAISNVTETPFTSIPPTFLIPIISKISKQIEKIAIQESNLVLTLSSDDSNTIRNIYGVDSKCTYAGAETSEFQIDEVFMRHQGLMQDQYLLYVSSYLGGMNTIIKAAKSLPERCFVIVGKGSTLIKLSNVPKNIKLLGIVSDNVLDTLYKYAKAVLVPMSWSPGLGVPIKFVEALAHGKPVIVSLSVSKTLIGIEHGKNALVFDTFSKFRKEIELIFNDHKMAEKIAQEAKKYAMKNLSWTTIIGNLEKYIENLTPKT